MPAFLLLAQEFGHIEKMIHRLSELAATEQMAASEAKSPVTSIGGSNAFLLERFVARRTVIPQHLEFRFSPEYRSDIANHCSVEVGIAM